MKKAPFFGFAFAYWALGNPAMMTNFVTMKQVMDEVTNPHHNMLPSSSTPWPALFMFIFFALSPFENLIRRAICHAAGLNFTEKLQLLLDTEYCKVGLDYIDCLQGIEQLRWYARALYQRRNIGVLCHSQDFIESLRTKNSENAKRGAGNMTYDLLQNERYRNLIGFVPFELQNLAKADDKVPPCMCWGKYAF